MLISSRTFTYYTCVFWTCLCCSSILYSTRVMNTLTASAWIRGYNHMIYESLNNTSVLNVLLPFACLQRLLVPFDKFFSWIQKGKKVWTFFGTQKWQKILKKTETNVNRPVVRAQMANCSVMQLVQTYIHDLKLQTFNKELARAWSRICDMCYWPGWDK